VCAKVIWRGFSVSVGVGVVLVGAGIGAVGVGVSLEIIQCEERVQPLQCNLPRGDEVQGHR
jgi:hypothetical protein